MTSPSNQYIEDLILSFARVQWQKVAMIVAKGLRACESEGVEVDDEALAERVRALVRQGKLESQGNLSRMRFSEVRLPVDEP